MGKGGFHLIWNGAETVEMATQHIVVEGCSDRVLITYQFLNLSSNICGLWFIESIHTPTQLQIPSFVYARSIKIQHFQFYLSTRSLSSLPALKNGSFFGATFTNSPVLGFRPVYPPYFFTKKEQSPRISTRSTFARASAIWSKKRVTIFSASDLARWFESFIAWMRSGLFTRSPFL